MPNQSPMLRRIVLILVSSFGLIGYLLAQDSGDVLTMVSGEIVIRTDAFGVEQPVIIGTLRNIGEEAYTDVAVFGEVLDAQGEVIGEAYGYLVNACGVALLEFAIQPGQTRRFEAIVELYEEDTADIATMDIVAEGTPVDPEPAPDLTEFPGIRQISDEEVVALRWNEDDTLAYGVGCDNRIFTTYDWYAYASATNTTTPIDPPFGNLIDETFIERIGILQSTTGQEVDPNYLMNSFMSFAPDGSRAVYQTDIHDLFTVESNGYSRRSVHVYLNRYSLQGINWTPENNFVAYYFGAYGEPVQYLTASAAGDLLSNVITENPPSVTIPGSTYDGRRVIIGGTFPDESGRDLTGYYFNPARGRSSPELLYPVETLPGNNYPAPAYYRKDDETRYIYIVRPIDDQPTLECFHYEAQMVTTLTPLPLQLASDERAWTWVSPDGSTLALAANGRHGGLWLVDLTQFEACQ